MPDKITTLRLPHQYQEMLNAIKNEVFIDPNRFNNTDTILWCIAWTWKNLEINKKTDE